MDAAATAKQRPNSIINYSRARNSPLKSSARPKPIIGGIGEHEISLKYLDDDREDYNENENENENLHQIHQDLRRSPVFKQLRESQDVISGRGAREPEPDYYSSESDEIVAAAEAQEQHLEQHQFDSEPELEEVYLCNLCGITRQLKPAMKYMPLFRGLFTLFNLLALMFALANITIGLWFRLDPRIYELHFYIETQNFTIAGWILLFGGLMAAFVSLIWAFSSSIYGLGNSLERFLTKEIYEQIRRRTMNSEPLMDDLVANTEGAQFLDFVQVKLRCCGAQDFRDYSKLGMVVPTTCYTVAGPYMNAPGCGHALRELLDLRAGLAAGLTAASVIVHLLASLIASLMVCSIYNYRAQPRPSSSMSMAARNSRIGTPI